MFTDKRTFEQLKEHYEIEKKLANRLRNASREERRYLYNVLYDELYRRVPHHPQLTQKKYPELRYVKLSRQMRFLKRYLKPESIFLEVGPGDCTLSLNVAKHVKKVYAIDVSEEITKHEKFPQNFELILSDGCSIPVPQCSISIAYSNQLMEHLHPEDAYYQLKNIYKALNNNGKYICITPNRLSGPHDVSKYFDNVATGFHLKEYTITELSELFRKVEFSKIKILVGGKGVYMKFPLSLLKISEKFLSLLPFFIRKKITNNLLFQALLGISIVGTK